MNHQGVIRKAKRSLPSWGQRLYSRPYSEEEIRKMFPMKVLKVGWETIRSKEYGEEKSLIVIFQKA